MTISVESPDITEGGPIPTQHTCDGEDVSPPLRWSGIPQDTGALALVVDDPDAPRGTFTHWVVVDIDPSVTSLARGQSPQGAQQIVNSAERASYMGPCPPSGVHRYRFTLYALSRRLVLPDLPFWPGRRRARERTEQVTRPGRLARGGQLTDDSRSRSPAGRRRMTVTPLPAT